MSKLDVFCFELSKLFVNSSATDIVLVTLSSTAVETAIAQCTSCWAMPMARGQRLNTSIDLAVVHGLSGLFWRVSTVEPSLSRPLPTLSPSLIGHLTSVDVKQHESNPRTTCPHRNLKTVCPLLQSLCQVSRSVSKSVSKSPSQSFSFMRLLFWLSLININSLV